jgi:hypothetical protein
MPACSLAGGARLRTGPGRLRGDRPRAPGPRGQDGVRGGPAGRRGSHLGGQRRAPPARAARLGATLLRSPLVHVCPARLDRRGHQFRGARSAAGGGVLHLVLPLLAHPGRPARRAGPGVAEDHPLRRPLALARGQRRSPFPAN